MLTQGIPPTFRGSVHLIIMSTAIGSVPSYRVTQLRTDGVHCRESAGTGPVNPNVVPNGCCLSRYHHKPINVRLSFPTPTIGSSKVLTIHLLIVDMRDTDSIRGSIYVCKMYGHHIEQIGYKPV